MRGVVCFLRLPCCNLICSVINLLKNYFVTNIIYLTLLSLSIWRGTVHLNKSIHHIFHINYQHFFINMYLFKQISKYSPRFFSFIFFSFSLLFGEDRRGYLPNISSSLSSLLWSSKGNSFLIGKYSISSIFNILFKLG